jgi:hypothetical protein
MTKIIKNKNTGEYIKSIISMTFSEQEALKFSFVTDALKWLEDNKKEFNDFIIIVR